MPSADGFHLVNKMATCVDLILFMFRPLVVVFLSFFKIFTETLQTSYFLNAPVCSQHLCTCLPYDNSTWNNFQKNNLHKAFSVYV